MVYPLQRSEIDLAFEQYDLSHKSELTLELLEAEFRRCALVQDERNVEEAKAAALRRKHAQKRAHDHALPPPPPLPRIDLRVPPPPLNQHYQHPPVLDYMHAKPHSSDRRERRRHKHDRRGVTSKNISTNDSFHSPPIKHDQFQTCNDSKSLQEAEPSTSSTSAFSQGTSGVTSNSFRSGKPRDEHYSRYEEHSPDITHTPPASRCERSQPPKKSTWHRNPPQHDHAPVINSDFYNEPPRSPQLKPFSAAAAEARNDLRTNNNHSFKSSEHTDALPPPPLPPESLLPSSARPFQERVQSSSFGVEVARSKHSGKQDSHRSRHKHDSKKKHRHRNERHDSRHSNRKQNQPITFEHDYRRSNDRPFSSKHRSNSNSRSHQHHQRSSWNNRNQHDVSYEDMDDAYADDVIHFRR